MLTDSVHLPCPCTTPAYLQLHPSAFEAAAAANAGLALTSRLQPGYDHSYFFIATFVDDHLAFHARHLLSGGGGAASS